VTIPTTKRAIEYEWHCPTCNTNIDVITPQAEAVAAAMAALRVEVEELPEPETPILPAWSHVLRSDVLALIDKAASRG
jgi:hypothetical protein